VRKLIVLMLCSAMTGCMINPPKPATPGPSATVFDAQAKLADKLPLGVTPESVTQDNAAAKSRELQAELDRASKNLAAARATSDATK